MPQSKNTAGFRGTAHALAFVALACLVPMQAAASAQDKTNRIGTSNYYWKVAYDANNLPYRIAEMPDEAYAPRRGCAGRAIAQTPYIVSFIGASGHFGNVAATNADRNKYYEQKMTYMWDWLTYWNCVRVVSIELPTPPDGVAYNGAPYNSYVNYPFETFSGAKLSGSQPVYWPMSKGAAAVAAITASLQKNASYGYAGASRWYLHGGSAGAMVSARLIDMLTPQAVQTTGYKLPEATILESLPISGNMYMMCANSNATSSANAIISAVYGNPSTCANVIANGPGFLNYKVLSDNTVGFYVAGMGKRIHVMMGANDPLWKEDLSATATNVAYDSRKFGWSAQGTVNNYLETIGLRDINYCGTRFGSFTTDPYWIYDSYAGAYCGPGGRVTFTQYQYGGHGPLSNFIYGYHPSGHAMQHLVGWVY